MEGSAEPRLLCAFLLPLALSAAAQGIACKPGCHPTNGFCANPNECRCQPGWRGPLCTECIPFPGCLHGGCTLPWQCVCQEGWVGSLCDIDTHPCSATPCTNNSTCIETGDGGYVCLCGPGFTGKNCHLRKGPCIINGSPCQNGGACVDGDGSAPHASCLCPSGFTGHFCELDADDCHPNPCAHGGACTDIGRDFRCHCPTGFTGKSCGRRLPACLDSVGGPRLECVCPHGLSGPTCAHFGHNSTGPSRSLERGEGPGDPPAQEALRGASGHHQERRVLKISLKEVIRHADPWLSHSQVTCLIVLGLLTCLVVLGTTAIVFYSKCETWLANAKYSRLLRKKKRRLMTSNNGETLSVNIIFPEKVKLTSYSTCSAAM
uniref:Protein delta homolog 1 n=1 Tax=Ornithorhynchus anatinus TaxID=9258 RepID=F6X0Y0_ORNAN